MDHMEKYLETPGYMFVECMSFYAFCTAMYSMATTRARRMVPGGYDSDDEDDYRSRTRECERLTKEYMGDLQMIVDVNYNHIINDILPRIKFSSDADEHDIIRQKVKMILSYIRLDAGVKWHSWNEKDTMVTDLKYLLRI